MPEPTPAAPHVRRAADGGAPRPATLRATDRMLRLLVLAAERDVPIGLTVAVGGVVVTGSLVSTLAYCQAVADRFASAAGGTSMDESFADEFRGLVDDEHGAAGGDRRAPADPSAYARAVPFLHLADARYVTAGGLLPAGRRGVLWTCRLDDVTNWSLGDLTHG